MQSPALVLALILLGVGVCLNTVVLAYFALRVALDGAHRQRLFRLRRVAPARPALATARR